MGRFVVALVLGGYLAGAVSAAPADGKWSAHPEVPIDGSAIPFVARFGALGDERNPKVLCRECFGHHPHGLEVSDSTIVDFFEKPFAPVEKKQDILSKVK